MMGPEPVMDMRKCAWITDKYEVTWQVVWVGSEAMEVQICKDIM